MRAGKCGLFLQFAVAVKRSYRGLHILSSMRKTANVVIDSDALLSAGPRKTLLGGNRMRSAMGSGRMWSITGAVILAACLTAVMPSLAHAASITGSNSGNVSIPDNDGWVYSGITISGAPSGAIVTGIDCHFSCIHTWSSDLDIDLKDQGSTRNYHMWSREGGSADNPSRTVSGIATFNGLAVNGTWKLFAKDMAAGDTGYIDEWWITIYYSLPGQINGSKWRTLTATRTGIRTNLACLIGRSTWT